MKRTPDAELYDAELLAVMEEAERIMRDPDARGYNEYGEKYFMDLEKDDEN